MEYRDIPVETLEQDEFGIERYVRALCDFIKSCDTPVTIALQGEWGSGKSSFMKILENCLCSETLPPQERYEPIWLNTWELFLENDCEQAVRKLVMSLIAQMEEHFEKLVQRQNVEHRKESLKNCLKIFSSVALDLVNVTSEHSDELLGQVFSAGSSQGSIRKAKDSLETFLTGEVEEKRNGVTDNAFLIFVDDLDRLEPKMAVTLLEALKNLFDIRKCIFILAIDYDIIACGVEEKYGKRSINKRNIQQDFFDKLIQVPYVIPMSKYQILPMVMRRLRKMIFFEREYNYTKYEEVVESIVKLSTNKNPRAIKRLMNMMQLVLSVKPLPESRESEASCSPDFRVLELLLMGLQLSFPQVYDMICHNSNLELWHKDHLAENTEISAYVREQFQLDEPWKEMIYLSVARDDVIRQNYYRVKELLEIYERLQNRCQRNGEQVEQALGIVNVISRRPVKEMEVRYDGAAYDKSSQTQQKQGTYLIDTTDFSGCRRVLDVGCGSGKTTIAMWMKNRDMEVTAFDISESQVETARANYQELLRQEREDMEEVSLQEAPDLAGNSALRHDYRGSIEFLARDIMNMHEKCQYDLIFSNAVMHWMREPKEAYRRLFEALTPGGELAVHQGGFGTYAGLHKAAREAIKRTGLTERFKHWIFPAYYPEKEELEELLEEIGYEDIRVESVYSDEKNNASLADNFANASLIYYKNVGLSDEEYAGLKKEFLHICDTEPVEKRAHRLYIHGFRP